MQHRVLLVYALYFPVLDFIKHVCAILIVAGKCLVLQLVVLDVDDLLQVEDVVDPLEHVPDQLLLVLYLHGSVWHQERIGDGHVDPLDLVAAAALAGPARAAHVEGRLLVRRDPVVLVQAAVVLPIAHRVLVAVVKVNIPWIDYSLLEVAGGNLVRAARLRSVLVRATVTLAHILNFLQALGPVACVLVILRSVRWLDIRLYIIIVCAWTCLASAGRCCSLRMT